MGKDVYWHGDAWDEYCKWMTTDKATLKRINELIKDLRRDPFHGIGKPEPLKHDLSGLWSRRIDEKNRLVYTADGDTVTILSCKGHYD